MEQFKLLHERFPTLSSTTKGLLLSAYLKMLLHDASNAALQAEVVAVFSRYSRQLDPELQQRSTEYLVRAWRLPACRLLCLTAGAYVTSNPQVVMLQLCASAFFCTSGQGGWPASHTTAQGTSRVQGVGVCPCCGS
jgi:hypothetical protein